MSVPFTSTAEPALPPAPGFWNSPGLRRFRRHKLAVFGAATIVFLTLACIVGPWLLPYTDTFIDIRNRFAPPFSGPHVLGTDPLAAQQLYREVLDEQPDHAEALAYSGWLLAITSRGASDDVRAAALDTAILSLRRATEVDPGYADPHCFLAIIAANFQNDPATARTEADECIANDPPADMRGLLDEFVRGLDATVPTEP